MKKFIVAALVVALFVSMNTFASAKERLIFPKETFMFAEKGQAAAQVKVVAIYRVNANGSLEEISENEAKRIVRQDGNLNRGITHILPITSGMMNSYWTQITINGSQTEYFESKRKIVSAPVHNATSHPSQTQKEVRQSFRGSIDGSLSLIEKIQLAANIGGTGLITANHMLTQEIQPNCYGWMEIVPYGTLSWGYYQRWANDSSTGFINQVKSQKFYAAYKIEGYIVRQVESTYAPW